MHFLQKHNVIQNMKEDNNSLTDNVHNMTSGIIGLWIEKEK